MSRPNKVGSYSRGPWLAMPTEDDQYEITCEKLPGWSETVSAEVALEVLRLLADEYRGKL